jgi:hypothetical protein
MLLSAALVTLTLFARAADDPSKPDLPPEEKASIEVYRLKNVDPADALQAFTALTGQPRRFSTTGPGRGTTTGPGGKRGTGTGFPADPFGPSDPLPTTTIQRGTVAHALADPRTRSLVVRGTDKDLLLAADVVAILDTPEGKELPAVKHVKAFRLQHIDAIDLAAMLQALDPQMTYRLSPVGRMKILLASGTDDQMKELADAVKKLDIPTESK